jgi:hypothetical protein
MAQPCVGVCDVDMKAERKSGESSGGAGRRGRCRWRERAVKAGEVGGGMSNEA